MSLSREDQRGDHVDEVAPYRRTPKVRYLMVFNGMVAQPAPAREDFMRSLIVAAVVAVASLYCAAPATAAPAPINGCECPRSHPHRQLRHQRPKRESRWLHHYSHSDKDYPKDRWEPLP